MDNQTQKYTQYRPYHFWAIHKRIFRQMWNDLSSRQRTIISNDAAHTSEAFQRFNAAVKAETERLFLDESFPLNAAHTFKVSYYSLPAGV